ncbi:hypothetical protein KY084_11600 [Stakelama sp. CBK3Z-3]|uniref:Uncharacterized protein n=1 Tax=Stakelama flava TaxID=2860338 RepID=A0ABS6XMT6_9SPHN|nr:hypothetical protein [Stakelama flava]MBW4331512.1 hypothetical protein [Stakelama flava]
MMLIAFAIAATLALTPTVPEEESQFVPPAGYAGRPPERDIAAPPDKDMPSIIAVPPGTVADRFMIVPDYPRDGHVKVIGAFAITPHGNVRLKNAWGPGFLPATLFFSDGRCYLLEADYYNHALSNGRFSPESCDGKRYDEKPSSSAPDNSGLHFIDAAWGYSVWEKTDGSVIVTAPYAKDFTPLFSAKMHVLAITAINGPDYPGGNVTLIGAIDGQSMAVILDVGF